MILTIDKSLEKLIETKSRPSAKQKISWDKQKIS